jgi:hypothetical protein
LPREILGQDGSRKAFHSLAKPLRKSQTVSPEEQTLVVGSASFVVIFAGCCTGSRASFCFPSTRPEILRFSPLKPEDVIWRGHSVCVSCNGPAFALVATRDKIQGLVWTKCAYAVRIPEESFCVFHDKILESEGIVKVFRYSRRRQDQRGTFRRVHRTL